MYRTRGVHQGVPLGYGTVYPSGTVNRFLHLFPVDGRIGIELNIKIDTQQ